MSSDLMRRARVAYELGRLRHGLARASVAAPATALGLLGCTSQRAATILCGAALFVLVAALAWRGQRHGRAAVAGLLAGAPALLVPLLCRGLTRHACVGGVCWDACLLSCVGGGLIAGAIVGGLVARAGAPRRGEMLVLSALVAILTGSLGCVIGGVPGIVGMAASLAVTGAPIAMLTPARR